MIQSNQPLNTFRKQTADIEALNFLSLLLKKLINHEPEKIKFKIEPKTETNSFLILRDIDLLFPSQKYIETICQALEIPPTPDFIKNYFYFEISSLFSELEENFPYTLTKCSEGHICLYPNIRPHSLNPLNFIEKARQTLRRQSKKSLALKSYLYTFTLTYPKEISEAIFNYFLQNEQEISEKLPRIIDIYHKIANKTLHAFNSLLLKKIQETLLQNLKEFSGCQLFGIIPAFNSRLLKKIKEILKQNLKEFPDCQLFDEDPASNKFFLTLRYFDNSLSLFFKPVFGFGKELHFHSSQKPDEPHLHIHSFIFDKVLIEIPKAVFIIPSRRNLPKRYKSFLHFSLQVILRKIFNLSDKSQIKLKITKIHLQNKVMVEFKAKFFASLSELVNPDGKMFLPSELISEMRDIHASFIPELVSQLSKLGLPMPEVKYIHPSTLKINGKKKLANFNLKFKYTKPQILHFFRYIGRTCLFDLAEYFNSGKDDINPKSLLLILKMNFKYEKEELLRARKRTRVILSGYLKNFQKIKKEFEIQEPDNICLICAWLHPYLELYSAQDFPQVSTSYCYFPDFPLNIAIYKKGKLRITNLSIQKVPLGQNSLERFTK